MQNQKIIVFNNGATLIYEKDKNLKTNDVTIGFRCGAQLDNEIDARMQVFKSGKRIYDKNNTAGLSHLVEHLMFRPQDTKNNILDFISKKIFEVYGKTSDNDIRCSFKVNDTHLVSAIKLFTKSITNNKFTKEQLDKEKKIILYEIAQLYQRKTLTRDFFKKLYDDKLDGNYFDKSGNEQTLKNITPQMCKSYVDKYFNLENLVVSIKTKHPITEIKDICEKYIFNSVKPAKKSEYIVYPFTPPKTHKRNIEIIRPHQYDTNVDVHVLFRERIGKAKDREKELAMSSIDSQIMNGLGGILNNQMRIKNQLVYQSMCYQSVVFDSIFKHFQFSTDTKNANNTLVNFAQLIKRINKNGIPQTKFNAVKELLSEQLNLNLMSTTSSESNYEGYIYNLPFVDYDKVLDYIKKMTYKNYNNYVTKIYKSGNVSILVEGDIKAKNMLKLNDFKKLCGCSNESINTETNQLLTR